MGGKREKKECWVSSIKTFICLKLNVWPDKEIKNQPAINDNCCDNRETLQIIVIIIRNLFETVIIPKTLVAKL